MQQIEQKISTGLYDVTPQKTVTLHGHYCKNLRSNIYKYCNNPKAQTQRKRISIAIYVSE